MASRCDALQDSAKQLESQRNEAAHAAKESRSVCLSCGGMTLHPLAVCAALARPMSGYRFEVVLCGRRLQDPCRAAECVHHSAQRS